MEKEIYYFVNKIKAIELNLELKNIRKNYFIFCGIPLIIKLSRPPWQFWGVGEKYINYFNTHYQNYILILLVSEDQGWFYTKKEVNELINNGKWHLRKKDLNYKIISPLKNAVFFNSYNDFITKINTLIVYSQVMLPEEVSNPELFTEGATRKISVNYYERSPEARIKCIEHYGWNCIICGFNFENKYGTLGKNFIHVHHIIPLSSINEAYKLNPIRDLRPICPNCHAMIHRKSPPYSVDEIKEIYHP